MSSEPEELEEVPVRLGDVVAGKYRVDHVLKPEALAVAEAVGRFEREARAAVKINSEHVARVLDVGALEGGAPYMVMRSAARLSPVAKLPPAAGPKADCNPPFFIDAAGHRQYKRECF